MIELPPPYTPLTELEPSMRERGYAVLAPRDLVTCAGITAAELERVRPDWDELPPDAYLKDGGRYRKRRHSCFTVDDAHAALVPHRAHWQPIAYNALHGGMERWFEPMISRAAYPALFVALGRMASQVRAASPWFVEAHQLRIDTTDGIGRPTPEGAHRDGVDFVAVLFVGRKDVKGGETRLFEADGPSGRRFTMIEPWTLLFLDDTRVIHESTPIQPLADYGYRDTLVVTFRAGGFQGG